MGKVVCRTFLPEFKNGIKNYLTILFALQFIHRYDKKLKYLLEYRQDRNRWFPLYFYN